MTELAILPVLLAALPTLLQAFSSQQSSPGAPPPNSSAAGAAPQASGDPYAGFKPGGSFAPPTIAALLGAAKGKNLGATALTAVFPGAFQAISSAASGPGRGEMRRAGARSIVGQSPGLLRIKAYVQSSGARTAADIAAVVRHVAASDAEAATALSGLLSAAAGGYQSAQGEAANQVGDALKFTFGLGTVRAKGAPSAEDVLMALVGGAATPSAPPAPPPSVTYTAQPFGPPVPLPLATSGTPLAFSPSTTPGGVSPMPTILDAVLAGVQAIPSIVQQFNPQSTSSSGVVLNPGLMSFVGPAGQGAMADAGLYGGGITEPFRLTAAGATAQVHVASNPATGRIEWFGPLGRPVLFSRDLAVCKRVKKISSRFGRAVGIRHARVRRGRR